MTSSAQRSCANPEQVMASHMRTSRAGLDIIKTYEGFRSRYQRLPDGGWIIGYGHVRASKDDSRINELEAEALLREYDLPPIERLIGECVLAPLNQNEFDALVSFAFNLGTKSFLSSDVVSRLNAGVPMEAASGFDVWTKARIGGKVQIVDALVRRRAAEKALFLKAPGAMGIASSRLIRPLPDRVSFPTLPSPPDIVVERAASQAIELPREQTARPGDALREASESVRRQMVRILGEDFDFNQTSPSADVTDGASPDEITAAISELAQSSEQGPGPTKSVWPSQQDLPPPPFFEDAVGPDTDTAAATDDNSAAVIDDLETVQIGQNEIDRAIEIDDCVKQEDAALARRMAFWFGGLSIVGALVFVFGMWMLSGHRYEGAGYKTGAALYMPLVTTLLGGILFVLMGFHLARECFRARQ